MAIDFYATVDSDSVRPYMPRDVAYLLPASSFWRRGFQEPSLPPGVRVAVDCGGYVNMKQHGGYPYPLWEYAAWCSMVPGLEWAAMPDVCCEDDLTAPSGAPSVRDRQMWTTEAAERFLESWGHVPWAWVPTVQGWGVKDYVRHAEDIAPLVFELQRWYGERQNYDYVSGDESSEEDISAFEATFPAAETFRVGIGTLCRRASPRLIREIVEAVAEVLPGVPFHLWGVKLAGLTGNDLPRSVVSVDSAAWNRRFGSTIQEHERERVAIYQRTGHLMTQREYGYRVTLPRYLDRFETQVNGRRFRRVMSVPRLA